MEVNVELVGYSNGCVSTNSSIIWKYADCKDQSHNGGISGLIITISISSNVIGA